MAGPRPVAALLVLALAAVPASASFLEDVSDHEISYQFDGETHHDAPDACQAADPTWSFDAGAGTDGLLVPPDDPSDVFVMDVSQAQVGQRLVVSLAEGVDAPDLLLSVLAPRCDGDVFALQNQPLPPPSPPAPAAGEAQASLPRGAEPMYCRDGAWYFGLSGLRGLAPPASVYAAWTDGSRADLPLAWQNGDLAAYGPADADVRLEGAWANLPAAWSGDFALAVAPCGLPDGGAVYGSPALLGNDWVAFTPVRAGPHEVVVSLAPLKPALPGSVPMSCHWCVPQVELVSNEASYKLDTRFAVQA